MKTTSNTTIRGAIAFLLALFLSFSLAPQAHAHARMVKSIPAKGATVTASPDQLDLWFNELLEEGFNTIEVFSSAELTEKKHTNLADGKLMLDPKDKTHLTAKLKSLPPGEYVVEWRVLSRDGHSAPGRITFSVGAAK